MHKKQIKCILVVIFKVKDYKKMLTTICQQFFMANFASFWYSCLQMNSTVYFFGKEHQLV